MYKVLVISVIDHARSKAGVSSCCHHSQWRTLLLALNPWLTMIPMKFEIWRNIPFFKDPQMKTAFFSRFIKMVESCMDVNLGPRMVINTRFS